MYVVFLLKDKFIEKDIALAKKKVIAFKLQIHSAGWSFKLVPEKENARSRQSISKNRKSKRNILLYQLSNVDKQRLQKQYRNLLNFIADEDIKSFFRRRK